MRLFLRTVALITYALLVGLFLAGYVAKYVHPRYLWWIQLLGVFLPYLSGLILLTGIPLVLKRRWGLLSVTALMAVLVGIRFIPSDPAGNASAVGTGERLSLMTLNFPQWFVYDGDRGEDLLALTDRYRPDILAIQEGWVDYHGDGRVRNARNDLSLLMDSASYVTKGPRTGRDGPSHALVFSLFPFEQVNFFELPYDPSGRYAARVTRAAGTWRQRPLVVYSVHMQSFGSDKPWLEDNASMLNPRTWVRYLRQYRDAIRRRASQAEQLAKMIRDETDPVIVMGDFNSTRNNWDFTWIQGELTDAFSAAGKGWGGTYHSTRPFARIDFILVSDHFDVLTAAVPNVIVSDHRPVTASVTWSQ